MVIEHIHGRCTNMSSMEANAGSGDKGDADKGGADKEGEDKNEKGSGGVGAEAAGEGGNEDKDDAFPSNEEEKKARSEAKRMVEKVLGPKDREDIQHASEMTYVKVSLMSQEISSLLQMPGGGDVTYAFAITTTKDEDDFMVGTKVGIATARGGEDESTFRVGIVVCIARSKVRHSSFIIVVKEVDTGYYFLPVRNDAKASPISEKLEYIEHCSVEYLDTATQNMAAALGPLQENIKSKGNNDTAKVTAAVSALPKRKREAPSKYSDESSLKISKKGNSSTKNGSKKKKDTPSAPRPKRTPPKPKPKTPSSRGPSDGNIYLQLFQQTQQTAAADREERLTRDARDRLERQKMEEWRAKREEDEKEERTANRQERLHTLSILSPHQPHQHPYQPQYLQPPFSLLPQHMPFSQQPLAQPRQYDHTLIPTAHPHYGSFYPQPPAPNQHQQWTPHPQQYQQQLFHQHLPPQHQHQSHEP
jgi:hypothetical protein